MGVEPHIIIASGKQPGETELGTLQALELDAMHTILERYPHKATTLRELEAWSGDGGVVLRDSLFTATESRLRADVSASSLPR